MRRELEIVLEEVPVSDHQADGLVENAGEERAGPVQSAEGRVGEQDWERC